MALLSNINDKFAVDSTGAIQFNGQAGTSGYILKSNGNAAPTWVAASTVIGGPYLPLSGGTLTGATATASGISFTVGGALSGTSATFSGSVTGTNATFTAGTATAGTPLTVGSSTQTSYTLQQFKTSAHSSINAYLIAYGAGHGSQAGNFAMKNVVSSGEIFFELASGVEPLRMTSTGSTFAGSVTATTVNLTGALNIDSALPTIKLTDTDTSAYARIRASNGGLLFEADESNTQADSNIRFEIDTDEKLRIESSGRVGIGTNSPNNKLDVKISTANRTTLEPVMSVSAEGSGPYTGFGPKISFSSNIYYGAATGNPAGIIETAYVGAVMGTTYATNSDLVFATRDGATSVTEKMRILGNGNVGIGTTSPDEKLDITGGYLKFNGGDYGLKGSASLSYNPVSDHYFQSSGSTKVTFKASGNVGIGTTTPGDFDGESRNLVIRGGVNGSTPTIGMTIATDGNQASSGRCAIRFADGINGNERYRGALEYNHNGDDMSFRTAGTQKMTLTDGGNLLITSGNVGIGTNSPARKLCLYENSSGQTQIQFQNSTTGVGSNDGFGVGLDSSEKGFLYHYDGGDIYMETGSALLYLQNSGGNVGISNTSPQTTLHTGPTTTITNVFTARFAASNFFASGGNSMFYVPDTAANIMMFGSNQFGTNQIEFYHKNPGTSQAYVGRISTSGSATSYVTSSDYRLKENIVPISDSISRLNQLKPSRFNFIEEPGKIVDGFIAHEVQDIVPEAIVGEKDEVDEDGGIIPQGIDQAKLVPLLVAAMQELEARVKELENK